MVWESSIPVLRSCSLHGTDAKPAWQGKEGVKLTHRAGTTVSEQGEEFSADDKAMNLVEIMCSSPVWQRKRAQKQVFSYAFGPKDAMFCLVFRRSQWPQDRELALGVQAVLDLQVLRSRRVPEADATRARQGT